MRLEWSPLTTSRDPGFMVKGTELAQAIVPGTRSRFAIVEVRALGADRMPDVTYRVRDAETVSDADVRAGKRPAVVFHGDYDACVAYCREHAPCSVA